MSIVCCLCVFSTLPYRFCPRSSASTSRPFSPRCCTSSTRRGHRVTPRHTCSFRSACVFVCVCVCVLCDTVEHFVWLQVISNQLVSSEVLRVSAASTGMARTIVTNHRVSDVLAAWCLGLPSLLHLRMPAQSNSNEDVAVKGKPARAPVVGANQKRRYGSCQH